MAVRVLDRGLPGFIVVDIALLALFAGSAGISFHLVGQSIGIRAPVGEDILYSDNLCVQIGNLFLNSINVRLGLGFEPVVLCFKRLVIRAGSDSGFGIGGGMSRGFQERDITVLPFFLIGLPWTLTERLV